MVDDVEGFRKVEKHDVDNEPVVIPLRDGIVRKEELVFNGAATTKSVLIVSEEVVGLEVECQVLHDEPFQRLAKDRRQANRPIVEGVKSSSLLEERRHNRTSSGVRYRPRT